MLQVRFYPHSLNYKPSFRLFFANSNEVFVSFYQWGTRGFDLPYLHLNKRDKTFFLPFKNLFDYLWENGVEADIENMPLRVSVKDIYTINTNVLNRIKRFIKFNLPPQLKHIPFESLKIAAASIAGRDSALAILRSIKTNDFDCILPILVGTPAKYLKANIKSIPTDELGTFGVRSETIKRIRQVIIKTNKSNNKTYILNSLFIEPDPHLWGTVIKEIEKKWNFSLNDLALNRAFSSPCIPCHVYIYYIRSMLCQRLGIKNVIGGDRILHDKKIKVNQLEKVIETISQSIKKEFDVNLITPLKETVDTTVIKKILMIMVLVIFKMFLAYLMVMVT